MELNDVLIRPGNGNGMSLTLAPMQTDAPAGSRPSFRPLPISTSGLATTCGLAMPEIAIR